MLFLSKNAKFLSKNADISKNKGVLVLKYDDDDVKISLRQTL